MEIVNRIPRMRSVARRLHKQGKHIAFVPTMGALHEGHLSLIRHARTLADIVVVSIFVNPIQFGKGEDFESYPRNLARDAELVASRGVDYLFAPSVDQVYPEKFSTYVIVEDLGDRLCGLSRPGHFRGVTTIVMKLFNIVQPDFAVFGQKDAQQAAIIKCMVRDLCVNTEIAICPIIRESDGLALSSRNTYLTPEQREAATILYKALSNGKRLFDGGVRDVSTLLLAMRQTIESEPLARIDYVSIVHPDTLEELSVIEEGRKALAALAVYIGRTRLIDNMIFGESPVVYDDEL